MKEPTVEERVCAIVADALALDEPPSLDAQLVEDFNIISLDVLTLGMELEEAFDLTIPEEALAEIRSVRDIVDYVRSAIEGQPEANAAG